MFSCILLAGSLWLYNAEDSLMFPIDKITGSSDQYTITLTNIYKLPTNELIVVLKTCPLKELK